ncbi:hypothetical protein SERLA73DRAFT_184588 [Serpula lacrymans var. lacrymans S7.3]|uniref:FAD-binding domain-containing protein n=2 Tax=Serpula lacrymans var. lacrymans TaxID=341189 RepID=F8Q4P1_SERL3|nr:uncharacterized protein SERLADRAFT_472353 [Serpula lacrymans var. lacrymans S7.9]EGN96518.1 hypothetical protein SERLA73DRAFT_184588 [Serpula lacrymans var. lacrymans S7.3]EGO22063.1 hypothetical protein SERLADRAFT_472353 [Serpula lacrymans var. lacrymans S7.9]
MSPTSTSDPVLIVGAGPSGLVAALTLLRNNIPVRIIDKEPFHKSGQRGPGIHARTLELFHILDVPEVAKVGTPVPPMRTYKPNSLEPLKTFFMSPYREPTPAIPYYNALLVGQNTLEGILRSHLEKFSCNVELGTELRSLEQHPDYIVVRLAKKQGDEEIEETFETKWLIGTDGAKGVTRKQLALTFSGETREEARILTGDIRLTGKGIDRKHWHIFGDSQSGTVVLRPTNELGEDGFQFVAAGRDVDVPKLAGSKEELFKFISSTIDTEIEFNELIWSSEFRPNIRVANKFSEGRVFIAGDAAHVHSPTGGQGLNSSVQDSFNLCWKLALVYKGLAPASLLESYTTERLPVIAEMLNITTEILDKTMNLTRFTADSAFVRTQRMNMLGVNYRTSPIVLNEVTTDAEPVAAYGLVQDGVLLAGDRARDAPALVDVKSVSQEVTTRLFDVFRTSYHTVLIFAQDAAKILTIVSTLKQYEAVVRSAVVLPATTSVESALSMGVDSADMVLLDREGHAYNGYLIKADETRVVIVRPDGVVGGVVFGEEGAVKYFKGILGSQA